MNRKMWGMGLVVVALAAWSVALAGSDKKTAEPLTGTWNIVAHGPDGDEQLTMTLEQTGEDVKGSIETPDGDLQITSGTFKDDVLEFHLETEDSKYAVTAKLENGELHGEWTKDADQKGTWEAKKTQEKTQ